MKLFIPFFSFFIFYSFSQEIIHKHSVHHAFVENKGQWDNAILFKSKFEGGNLWVQQHKLVFHITDYSNLRNSHANFNFKGNPSEFKQDVVHLNLVGSNEIKEILKEKQIDSYYNYFMGNDSTRWKGAVGAYSEANLKNLYNGIDLKLIEENGSLKYEFHVTQNINPALIQMEYVGQKNIKIDRKGNLIIETKLGEIQEQKPYAYQIVNGNIREVSCNFKLTKNRLSFDLGAYNKDFELIIDPVLIFATYSGSITDNFGMTATYGHDGTAYSAGTIFGNAYPTPDNQAYDVNSNFTVQNIGTYATTDVFISKYSSDGKNMLWTTFLGGGDNNQGTETAHSLICDKQNNVYIYGATSSLDFPIQGGYQDKHGGGQNINVNSNGANFTINGTDIYIAKISSDGRNLLGSTYMGGSNDDGVNYSEYGRQGQYSGPIYYDSLTTNYGDQFRGEIMLDSSNNCLVASCTRSLNFPTLNSFQTNLAGKQDGVVFKLNSNLSNLLFSSFYGGSDNDACYSVKIDSSYNIVFAGGTSSLDLQNTAGSYQASFAGGNADGFVAKLDPNGTSLIKSTYLGTANYDQVFFVEIDRNDKVFVIGQSQGGQFPVLNSAYVNPNSGQFIAKLDANLSVLENATVFGNGTGELNISPSAFLVDICGNIYVSGWGGNILNGSATFGMPTTPDAVSTTAPNGFDFYLLVLERGFSALKYASYLGGANAQEHVDGGTSRFDKNGVVYQSVCGGCGGFSDFPTTQGAWSNQNLSSNCNNVVFKFDFELVLTAEFTVSQELGCAPFTVNFINNSSASDTYLWDLGNGDTSTVIFNPSKTFNFPGNYIVTLITRDSVCLLSDTAKILISVGNPFAHSVSNDTVMCKKTSIELAASGFGIADQFIWSSNVNFSDTLNSVLTDSIFVVTPQLPNQTFYVKLSNFGCSVIDSVNVKLTSANLNLVGDQRVCENEDYNVQAINSGPFTFTYSWYPQSLIKTQISPTQLIANSPIPAYLLVDVIASNSCSFTDSILIDVSPVNSTFVTANASQTVIVSGGQTTLIANPIGNYTYQWSPITGLSAPNSQTTLATVNNSTVYTVTITDGVCTHKDSVLITCVSNECKPPEVFVPNAFSPNNKGNNELFLVRGPQIVEMLLRVYDRWGELVFETVDQNEGWDGSFKGKKLDPDVFDYYLKVTCIGGNTEIIKGNVTLLK